jgi:arginyl-tRNA synthetase
LAIIQEKNPDLQNKQAIAKEVALAAIKYFDLSHNRKTEIVFTWDKALSFEGNTGPYLQYTHARIHGILRKAGQMDPPWHPSQTADMGLPERAVLGKLVLFPEILSQIAEEFLPNILCNYLFELSQSFNQFYETSPVMQEKDEAKKHLRLAICSATAQVISNGLYLLGINAPEEM